MSWPAISTARTLIDLGSTLATDTLSGVGGELDNATNLDKLGWLEIATSSGNLFSTAVTRDQASFDIYMVQAPDGTNYNLAPTTGTIAQLPHLLVAVIPCAKLATIVPQILPNPIGLPPHKVKFYLYNNTDQTMQNTWELNLYTNNPTS